MTVRDFVCSLRKESKPGDEVVFLLNDDSGVHFLDVHSVEHTWDCDEPNVVGVNFRENRKRSLYFPIDLEGKE